MPPTDKLTSNVYATVTIDGVTFGSPLVIETGVTVRPLTVPRTAVDTGLTSTLDNAYVTNMGSVYGSTGSSFYTQGLNGGMGVSLTLTGDHIANEFLIAGGAGGSSNRGGYGGYGGAGGVGLNLLSTGQTNASSNAGTIRGGAGGNSFGPYGSGGGGDGADVRGAVLQNTGDIIGGTGGGGTASTAGGGIGVALGAGATLDNGGNVSGGIGGSGYTAAPGGIGVNLGSGATLNTLPTAIAIIGGTGGGGFIGNSQNYGGGSGGAGGVGLEVAAGTQVTGAAATIRGGNGGDANYSGAGGAGIVLNAGATLTNDGSVTGGTAGTGHAPTGYVPLGGYLDEQGGGNIGGDGVDITNATLTNLGGITGGSGGASTQGRLGGIGGNGVDLNGGQLYTAGAIQAGAGGVSAKTGGSGPGGYSVKFGPNLGTMHVAYGASFGGNIGGFARGDVIDFANLTPAQTQAYTTQSSYYNNQQFNPFGTPYTVTTTSIDTPHDGDLVFVSTVFIDGRSSGYSDFHFTPDGTGGTDFTVACYLRGTHILTATGESPIEDLCIGQSVRTRDGRCRPIKWIGRRSYRGSFIAGSRNVLPVRIGAGALADGVPHRDLYVSPMHALYLDDMLIPAIDLVNGTSIVQLDSVDTVEYFHLELATHDVIVAEGALSESYVDDDNRGMFHNADDFAARYPGEKTSKGAYCALRVSEGFELEAVRQRLNARGGSSQLPGRHARRPAA